MNVQYLNVCFRQVQSPRWLGQLQTVDTSASGRMGGLEPSTNPTEERGLVLEATSQQQEQQQQQEWAAHKSAKQAVRKGEFNSYVNRSCVFVSK